MGARRAVLLGLRGDLLPRFQEALAGDFGIVEYAATLREVQEKVAAGRDQAAEISADAATGPVACVIVGGGLDSATRGEAVAWCKGEAVPVAEVHLWKVWRGGIAKQVRSGLAAAPQPQAA